MTYDIAIDISVIISGVDYANQFQCLNMYLFWFIMTFSLIHAVIGVRVSFNL